MSTSTLDLTSMNMNNSLESSEVKNNSETKESTPLELPSCVIHEFGGFTIKTKSCSFIVSRHIMAMYSEYFKTFFLTYPDILVVEMDDDVTITKENIQTLLQITPVEKTLNIIAVLKLAEKWQVVKSQIIQLLDRYIDIHASYPTHIVSQDTIIITADGNTIQEKEITIPSTNINLTYVSYSDMHSTRLNVLLDLALFYHNIQFRKTEAQLGITIHAYYTTLLRNIKKCVPIEKEHYIKNICMPFIQGTTYRSNYFNQTILMNDLATLVSPSKSNGRNMSNLDHNNLSPNQGRGGFCGCRRGGCRGTCRGGGRGGGRGGVVPFGQLD